MTTSAIKSTAITASAEAGDDIVSSWVAALEGALSSRNAAAINELFERDCTVRDLLALSWDFRNAVGRDEVVELLSAADSSTEISVRVRREPLPILGHENGRRTIAQFLSFRTKVGEGEGFVKLVEGEGGAYRAMAFVLALSAVDTHPEQVGDLRPLGRSHGPNPSRLPWHEELDHEFTRKDPTVVILGAGHNGLMLAARLRVLGIPTLIVESNARVGDNWRNRYSSLALHTPLASDQLPYVPFPPTWTRFTPKDKFGDFLESYASLLDLAVWTGSTAENVNFDVMGGRWSLDVIRPDGSRRTLTPQHLVFATGMNGEAHRPDLPGEADYKGTVIHAVDYKGAEAWAGKQAVVVGTGVSGHDLAQDLAEHGVDVTIIQRSGTVVMDTSTFHAVMHANHTGGHYTVDEADLVNASTPFGALPSYGAAQLALVKERDHELLAALSAAGFKLSDGPNGQGVLGLIFGQNATGYYYNAGASELIADGTVKLRHGSVTSFNSAGIVLDDCSSVEADLVIFATGYRGPATAIRKVLGDAVADQVGNFADVGEDREYGRLWRQTGVDKLWFMVSLGIGDGRFYSKLLALQIAAMDAGTLCNSGN
ncbi:flavin-containing monooxygenase [Arthrobacter sp. 2RAF6]|uniref:flavin-containing monooxygenase n=1 Tax=Arthrobacter sp. 2RAF6 TaxID=3233002 RepID=UPI003F91CCD0